MRDRAMNRAPASRAGSSTDQGHKRAALVQTGTNVSDVVTAAPRERLVDALLEARVNSIKVPGGEVLLAADDGGAPS